MEIHTCPDCGHETVYYDTVQRIQREKGGIKELIPIERYRCIHCRKIHRELPDSLLPYKQYDKEIIRGVVEGWITSETLGYEDYPCEMTIHRWCSQNLQLL